MEQKFRSWPWSFYDYLSQLLEFSSLHIYDTVYFYTYEFSFEKWTCRHGLHPLKAIMPVHFSKEKLLVLPHYKLQQNPLMIFFKKGFDFYPCFTIHSSEWRGTYCGTCGQTGVSRHHPCLPEHPEKQWFLRTVSGSQTQCPGISLLLGLLLYVVRSCFCSISSITQQSGVWLKTIILKINWLQSILLTT